MITVGSYYRPEHLGRLLEQLSGLPDELRPTHFGIGESKPAAANKVTSTARFETFARKNPKGYFLFAKECRYDVTTAFRSGYGTVYVDPLAHDFDDDLAIQLFHCLADVGEFTFACDTEEYLYRNRLTRVVAESSVEAWVGRDLGKYIPGIYWLTGMSGEVVSRLALGAFVSKELAHCTRIDGAGGVRIAMGKRSVDWRDWETQVTDFCAQHPRVFCAREVLAEADEAMDYLTLSGVLGRWI